MTKEALEKVKEAEEIADNILKDAKNRAREMVQDAEVLATRKYDEILDGAEQEVEWIHNKAIEEGHLHSIPILENGARVSKKIRSLTIEQLKPAVDCILERVVKSNGHC